MSDDIGHQGHDHEYLIRRETQERAAAEQSADPSARRAHETLAAGYVEQLQTISII